MESAATELKTLKTHYDNLHIEATKLAQLDSSLSATNQRLENQLSQIHQQEIKTRQKVIQLENQISENQVEINSVNIKL